MWEVEYSERLKVVGLDPLELRRIRFDIIECFKIINGFSAIDKHEILNVSRLNTRQRISKFDASNAGRHHFFSNRVVPMYNSLPDSVCSAENISKFKSLLSKYENSFSPSPLNNFLRGRSFVN